MSLFFAFWVGFLGSFQSKDQQKKPFYFAPPEVIHHFSLGFSDLYADILWMKLIQNIDFCSSQKGLPIYDGTRKYQCEKGWSYKMTLAITNLAPLFLKPYEISAGIMSILMGDKLGAKIIYDKACKNFPDNWKIHFSAGYHYLIELQDKKKAAQLFTKAAKLGGPPWLYALVSKTYGDMGKLLLSREVLLLALQQNITEQYKEVLKARLKELEEKIKQSKKDN